MSIAIGRRIYVNGKPIDPKIPKFTKVIPLTASTPHFELSPYYLRDKNGFILENIWQFAKLYNFAPKVDQIENHTRKKIWKYPYTKFVEDGEILWDNYLAWRSSGMANPHPVRYPVGFEHRKQCLSLLDLGDLDHPDKKIEGFEVSHLPYIESRKEVYVKLYQKLVLEDSNSLALFEKLVSNGKNLLIIDVDGPHYESLNYYQEKYNVDEDFIMENHTMILEKDTYHQQLDLLLNDPTHPYGHGFCLARMICERRY